MQSNITTIEPIKDSKSFTTLDQAKETAIQDQRKQKNPQESLTYNLILINMLIKGLSVLFLYPMKKVRVHCIWSFCSFMFPHIFLFIGIYSAKQIVYA